MSSVKGKILGKNEADHIEVLHQLISGNVKDYVDFSLNERLLTILSTNENVSLSTLGFESDVDDYYAIIAPIDIAGERFEHYLCTAREKIIPLMILS